MCIVYIMLYNVHKQDTITSGIIKIISTDQQAELSAWYNYKTNIFNVRTSCQWNSQHVNLENK